MIVYYLGIPGSGKSYSGVNTIYDNFTNNEDAKKDLKKDYYNCYTNINEFKFDKCHHVYHLDFDELLEKLTILYNLANGIEEVSKKSDEVIDVVVEEKPKKKRGNVSSKYIDEENKNVEVKKDSKKKKVKKKKATDGELIAKAEELDIYRTLFVIDECHNFFDKQNKILVWWLTYHRHLYHDIILITQNLGLVHAKYKPLAEAFYRAKPNSLTLVSKYFNYTYFTDSRMTKASKVNTKKVLKRQGVFELYHSGDSVDSKNVIKHFLLIALGLTVLLFFLMYYFYGRKHQEIKEKSISKPASVKTVSTTEAAHVKTYILEDKHKDAKINYSQKKFIVLNCSISHCSNSSLDLPAELLFKFEKMNLIHVFYKEKISNSFTILYCSADLDVYNFLSSKSKGGDNNAIEQTLNSPTAIFSH